MILKKQNSASKLFILFIFALFFLQTLACATTENLSRKQIDWATAQNISPICSHADPENPCAKLNTNKINAAEQQKSNTPQIKTKFLGGKDEHPQNWHQELQKFTGNTLRSNEEYKSIVWSNHDSLTVSFIAEEHMQKPYGEMNIHIESHLKNGEILRSKETVFQFVDQDLILYHHILEGIYTTGVSLRMILFAVGVGAVSAGTESFFTRKIDFTWQNIVNQYGFWMLAYGLAKGTLWVLATVGYGLSFWLDRHMVKLSEKEWAKQYKNALKKHLLYLKNRQQEPDTQEIKKTRETQKTQLAPS